MEEKILNRLKKEIKENKDLFFTEIERIFDEENFEYTGNRYLAHPENENLIVWINWNENAINIIMKLLQDPNIVASGCNTIEMLLYSVSLNFPIAKRINFKYKNPHWFPTKIKWVEN